MSKRRIEVPLIGSQLFIISVHGHVMAEGRHKTLIQGLG